MQVTYEYGQRGDLPPVKLTWYQGENKPEIWQRGGIPQWGNGHLFVGDKGMLLSDYGKFTLLPEADFEDYQLPDPTIPRVASHYADWLDACKSGRQSSANFEYSGWLTEANHLGNVAYRLGQEDPMGSGHAGRYQRAGSRRSDPLPLSVRLDAVGYLRLPSCHPAVGRSFRPAHDLVQV